MELLSIFKVKMSMSKAAGNKKTQLSHVAATLA